MEIKKILEYIDGLESFIVYNVDKQFITPETTVEGVLDFLDKIKTSYIPLIEQINNSMLLETSQTKPKSRRGRKPKEEIPFPRTDSETI